MLIYFKCYNC